MMYKTSNIFSYVLASPLLWIFLILFTLIDSSKYNFELFTGNFVASFYLFIIIILLTNRISFSLFCILLITQILIFSSVIKADLLCGVLNLQDLGFLSNFLKLDAHQLILSYFTSYSLIYAFFILWAIYFVYRNSQYLINFQKKNWKTFLIYRSVMLSMGFVLSYVLPLYLTNENSFANKWINITRHQRNQDCQKQYPYNSLKKVHCMSMGPLLDIAHGISNPTISGISTTISSKLIKRKLEKYYPDKQSSPIQTFQFDNNKRNVNSNLSYNKLPNIVLVLNESLFDPSNLDYDFTRDRKFDLFYNKEFMKSNGYLRVHTFGGGSAISEYNSLTGIVQKVFKGPNLYPFINMVQITQPSLFKSLKNVGYYTVVIYPNTKKFMNANNAYNSLGADKIVDVSDYGHKPKDWRDVNESLLGKMIINEIEKAPKNMPVFVAAATMRNHGPHSSEFPHKLGCSQSMDNISCSKVNDFLERLKNTDKEWMEFIRKIMSKKQKILLINYGDHLPSFEGKMNELKLNYTDGKNYDIYRTFFNIRSNFDLPDVNYNLLDISFFPSLILDIIGQNNSEFYRASSYVREKCSGLLFECKTKYPELIESYKQFMIEQLEK